MTKGRTIPPQATPAAEWAATTSLPLPSGRVVEVRVSIGLGAIAAGVGGIPNVLRDDVARLILSDDPMFDDEEDETKRIARTQEYKAGMLALASIYVVSPKIVLDREPDVAAGEVSGLSIDDTDLYTIYNAAQAGPRALKPFPVAGRVRTPRSTREALWADAQPTPQD